MRRCFGRGGKKKKSSDLTLVLLGLDNAGKSTLMLSLAREVRDVTPTVGFTSQVVRQGKTAVRLYDLGGCEGFRGIWERYYAEVHGALLVVDAGDPARFAVAKDVLGAALADPRMQGKPVVLFANKQDSAGAATAEAVAAALGMPPSVKVFGCVARAADVEHIDPKVFEGLEHVLGQIKRDWTDLSQRIEILVAKQRERDAEERAEKLKQLEIIRAERAKEEAAKAAQQQQQQVEEQSIPGATPRKEGPADQEPSDNCEKAAEPKPPEAKGESQTRQRRRKLKRISPAAEAEGAEAQESAQQGAELSGDEADAEEDEKDDEAGDEVEHNEPRAPCLVAASQGQLTARDRVDGEGELPEPADQEPEKQGPVVPAGSTPKDKVLEDLRKGLTTPEKARPRKLLPIQRGMSVPRSPVQERSKPI
eukprot:m51a1_g13872 putative adp-ribosylation factor-like protein 13b (421) ;mRNA; r:628707-630189